MTKEMIVIVFSCQHKREYKARIDKVTEWILENKIDPIFIFTGIDPPPLQRVINIFGSNRIIWENESTSTQSNVKNTLEVIKKHQINHLGRVWVSSWYHIPKIKLFLRKVGINVKRETFVKSHSGIALIDILVEPFALLAAKFGINKYPIFTLVKRIIGYNV